MWGLPNRRERDKRCKGEYKPYRQPNQQEIEGDAVATSDERDDRAHEKTDGREASHDVPTPPDAEEVQNSGQECDTRNDELDDPDPHKRAHHDDS